MTFEIDDQLAASVQPLVFETGYPDFPYAIKGTGFLVGYEGRAFMLTAGHNLHFDNLTPLFIFPTDSSQQGLPLKDVFLVPREVSDDCVDIAVIEIDLTNLDHPDLRQARIVDLKRASGDWLSYSDSANLIIFGYPEELSFVKYDEKALITERVSLKGRYRGPSMIEFLHEFEVLDMPRLSTFSGLSGAPVFALIEGESGIAITVLCGMALRGTPAARCIHFLDRSVLLDALKVRCRRT